MVLIHLFSQVADFELTHQLFHVNHSNPMRKIVFLGRISLYLASKRLALLVSADSNICYVI